MKPLKNRQGFTLLEIIVSISILALIALMLTRIFTQSTSVVTRGRDRSLLDETARMILNNIATDVSQAMIRTNVPFRVSTVNVGDALYCISTGVRRKTETNPRDMAPVRTRSVQRTSTDNGLVPALNRRAAIESASGGTSTSATGLRNLSRQSDYWSSTPIERDDFQTMSDNLEINSGETSFYTEALEETDGVVNQATLTHLTFRINGDFNSNRTETDLPTSSDLPRFVDIELGLISAQEMQQAMRIHTRSGSSSAEDFLRKREQIYTRRVFMPNTGSTRIDL